MKAAAETSLFVELRGLTKTFGHSTVVDNVDLVLNEGEFFSMLGPSGCGKSTTLRMIGGFELPSSGQVLLDGVDMSSSPPNRRPVNMVFQSYALFSHLDVYANVEFGLREARVPRAERKKRVADVLSLVRLDGLERRKPRQLSGGQQQRVALARAIVNQPRLLLLDEPLGALDLKLRRAMQSELKALQNAIGTTFVYVTHDQEEALTMSDRIAVMRDGRIEQVGSPEEIYDRPSTAYVADFIGKANSLPVTVTAVEGEQATVSLPDGTSMTASMSPHMRAGIEGILIVRAERVKLAAATEPGGLAGTIREVVFLGMQRAVVVELKAGGTITAYLPHLPSEPFADRIGAEVTVVWEPSDGRIVPGGDHG